MVQHTAIGVIGGSGKRATVTTAKGEVGYAVFGPYQELAPGDYQVDFSVGLMPSDTIEYDEHLICAFIEVTAGNGAHVLARRAVFARNANQKPEHSLIFRHEHAATLEYRVYATGLAPIVVRDLRPVSAVAYQGRFVPVLKSSDEHFPPFFEEHFLRFRDLYEKGAKITTTVDAIVVDFLGVKMNVSNFSDFQLIYEILIKNTYNFVCAKPAVVIDVGMNVGLASLSFAKMPNVTTVYAFEPFAAPLMRAIENFKLNPTLSDKIKAFKYGLGLHDQKLTVSYDPEHTIDVSIHGRAGGGSPVEIEVKDAGEEIGKIIEGAGDGVTIVLKLDCEGSEFPIMQSLDNAGIVDRIGVIMCEWHKAWAPNGSQKEIVNLLISKGFSVFDDTDPFDPYAGRLYAANGR